MLVDGTYQAGTLLIAEGKIKSGKPGKDVPTYDLGDTIVTPGLVIAHSSLGQASTVSDPTESDASHLRAVDAFDPTTKRAKETLADGFIHVGLAPGASNTSSGAMGHVRLGTGDYVAAATIANQFVLSSSARNVERYPASLNGQVRMINDLFNGSSIPSRVYLSESIATSIANEKLSCVKEVHRQ
jgi:imidazolonepropionase-like amidohydrolase